MAALAIALQPVLALGGPPKAPSVPATSSQRSPQSVVLSVFHGPASLTLADPEKPGHRLGVLRVLPAKPITDATGAEIGRLDAQMVTSSIDYPNAGDEIRMAVLTFSFGQGSGNLVGSADQLVVSGSGFYAGTESTISAGNVVIRPIIGGSGRFAGARGWAESEHFGNGTWRHTFHFLKD